MNRSIPKVTSFASSLASPTNSTSIDYTVSSPSRSPGSNPWTSRTRGPRRVHVRPVSHVRHRDRPHGHDLRRDGTLLPRLASGAVVDDIGNPGPVDAVDASTALVLDRVVPTVTSFASGPKRHGHLPRLTGSPITRRTSTWSSRKTSRVSPPRTSPRPRAPRLVALSCWPDRARPTSERERMRRGGPWSSPSPRTERPTWPATPARPRVSMRPPSRSTGPSERRPLSDLRESDDERRPEVPPRRTRYFDCATLTRRTWWSARHHHCHHSAGGGCDIAVSSWSRPMPRGPPSVHPSDAFLVADVAGNGTASVRAARR